MKSDFNRLLREKFGEPIGMMAGQSMIGVRDERSDACPSCGMMPIGGSCGCSNEAVEVCDGCGMPASDCACAEADACPVCSMMPVGDSCGCGSMHEGKEKSACECGAKVVEGEVCQCGINEVAPPGHEKMVKGLKKAQAKGDVENAYAVAWHHYKVKHPGGKGKKH